jgi:hypothetical protein
MAIGRWLAEQSIGHMRSHCTDLVIYCEAISCNHSIEMNADHLPDEPVLAATVASVEVARQAGIWGTMVANPVASTLCSRAKPLNSPANEF